jgi:hypothetical protein
MDSWRKMEQSRCRGLFLPWSTIQRCNDTDDKENYWMKHGIVNYQACELMESLRGCTTAVLVQNSMLLYATFIVRARLTIDRVVRSRIRARPHAAFRYKTDQFPRRSCACAPAREGTVQRPRAIDQPRPRERSRNLDRMRASLPQHPIGK